jgi:hypothetical protein
MSLDYNYDAQFRRYLQQFVRIFTGFQYASGRDSAGRPVLRVVPAKLAVKDRQVGHILRNNSENTMLTVPQITCDIANMTIARDRTQSPNFVSTVQVYEREYNPVDNKYVEELGKTYTVQRYMAVPYDVTMQMDLWTSNEFQKHQILEQVLQLFNPSIDIQSGTNPIDWTSLTIVELMDINWSSRGITIGNDDSIEISTLTFKMPIWLSPPAKVQRQNIIRQIITNIAELDNLDGLEGGDIYWNENDLLARVITTPGNHMVDVDGQEITLLGANGAHTGEDGQPLKWEPLLLKYGKFRPGISQIRLKTNGDMDDHDSDIVGSLEFHPTDPSKLLWVLNIESLPRNTLADINAVIDPHAASPGVNLPEASQGQRYMILQPIRGNNLAWGPLNADTHDIIQYSNGEWIVSFDSSEADEVELVLNTRNAKQMKWDQGQWQLSLEGTYNPGYWRLFL